MQDFTFKGMPDVYFGKDALKRALKERIPSMGRKVLVAYGGGSVKRNGVYDAAVGLLHDAGIETRDFGGIMPNPTYAKVQEGAALAMDFGATFILALGGGSAIDCSKIVSAQAMLPEDIWEMEFGRKRYPSEFIPMGAVVTASGTGSEMNNGAVITNEQTRQKNGLLGARADFAVLDPSYTLTVPMGQAVSGAFDTLSHCMETYFGRPDAMSVSDRVNEAVMRDVIVNIRAMIADPRDLSARSDLMWDSSLAECGLLKLGKVTDFQNHMIEHQLGAYTDCNHGQGLAVIHPAVYRHIEAAAQGKFARFGREVFGVVEQDDARAARAGIDALASFIKEIGLPSTLGELKARMKAGSPDPTDKALLRKVADSTFITKGCARKLDADEIYEILCECI